MFYCFSVMMGEGNELTLVTEQNMRGVGIFACDLPSVLSDRKLLLQGKRQIFTRDIGDLTCSYGGKYGLALNSEIFVRAWKKVFEDADYLLARWTVKLDPDTVFVPDRLEKLLDKSDAGKRVYYNNCDHGLHGPIEVISRGGMGNFAEGILDCELALKGEWSEVGEDVFVRHCMGILNVMRVDNYKLLSEDHCFHEDPRHDGCVSGKVAFHPFKTSEQYVKCLGEATADG